MPSHDRLVDASGAIEHERPTGEVIRRRNRSPRLPENLLRFRDVVRQTKASDSTVRRWRRDGVLPAVTIGGTVRFRQEDLDALIASSSESAAGRPRSQVPADDGDGQNTD